jgi:hypothetical protein
MQAKRGSQNQIRPVRLQQIGRADIGSESMGYQRHHIREGIGRFASLRGKVRNFLKSEDETGVGGFVRLGHRCRLAFRMSAEKRLGSMFEILLTRVLRLDPWGREILSAMMPKLDDCQ